MTPARGAICIGVLVLTSFYVGASQGADSVPTPEPVTKIVYKDRVIEKRVEVPVDVVREVPLPQVCSTIGANVSAINDLNGVVGKQIGLILPVLNDAAKAINTEDIDVLNGSIKEVRDIRNETGTAQIKLDEALDGLTTALEECRQEMNR